MRDSQHGGQSDRSGDGLSALARTVVARLVSRDAKVKRPPDAAMVAALARALAASDHAPFEALRTELRRARVNETELVDSYFPAVARFLGREWAEDRAPFTDVTMGVARMQSILRQVGRSWDSNAAASVDSATVLMVLPDGEQHSFGVMVLTGQLRRQGISVQMQIGARPAMLQGLVRTSEFDCAMVSVACEEKLEFCRGVVKAIKDGSEGRLWVAVGGAVLERPVDVRAATGADVATNDPMIALQGARVRNGVPVREVG
jgi:MerR family transcriptional regulator, light-induced transcriptional regulator